MFIYIALIVLTLLVFMTDDIKSIFYRIKTHIPSRFIIFLIVVFIAVISVKNIISSNQIMLFQKENSASCNRTEPFDIPPEFQRALSLRRQRLIHAGFKSTGVEYNNCLDIQYKDLSEQQAEGYFLFDPNSTVDHLQISVDSSYVNYDDMLTAILLSHELIHAGQFIQYKADGINISCFDKEIQAFSFELDFIASLNKEEQDILIQRIMSNPSKNNAYMGIYELFQINVQATNACRNTQDKYCFSIQRGLLVKQMVESSLAYQEQCKNTP